jgi:hypothetical protein
MLSKRSGNLVEGVGQARCWSNVVEQWRRILLKEQDELCTAGGESDKGQLGNELHKTGLGYIGL